MFSLPEIQELIYAWSQDQRVGCDTFDSLSETTTTDNSTPATATATSDGMLAVEKRPATVNSSSGENVFLSVTVNASRYDAPAVDLTLPTNWSVVDYQATNATYRSSEDQWVWLTGDKRVLNYTVAIPENASTGNRTITVEASGINSETGGRSTVTDDSTISIGGEETTCIGSAVAGPDNRISLTEIQQAINWWAEGKTVPDTDGETISLSKIQQLINTWAKGTTVTC